MPFEVISSQSGLRVKSGPGWLSRTGLVAGATLAWTVVLTNGWPTSSVLFSSLFAFGLFALTLGGLLGVFPRREAVAVDVAHRQVEVTASALLLTTTEKIPIADIARISLMVAPPFEPKRSHELRLHLRNGGTRKVASCSDRALVKLEQLAGDLSAEIGAPLDRQDLPP